MNVIRFRDVSNVISDTIIINNNNTNSVNSINKKGDKDATLSLSPDLPLHDVRLGGDEDDVRPVHHVAVAVAGRATQRPEVGQEVRVLQQKERCTRQFPK